MGDRCNVVIQYADLDSAGKPKRVYFYGHWSGNRFVECTQDALKSAEGRGRWSDESYLSRIIFNYLQGDDRGETGFGISPFICDNEHDLLVVSPSQNKVWRETEGGEVKNTWSFAEFIAIEKLQKF